MIVPPPPTGKPVAFYDTESFINFWLLKIRPQGGSVYSFSLRGGETFDQDATARIEYLMNAFTVVSFNGIYYDAPIIGAALNGFSCEQLKWISDEIIVKERKHWELGLPEWKPLDHIDIIEVMPGSGSQKQYAGRIHYKTMRDLPYEPDVYLTEPMIAEVSSYCENDLRQLEAEYMAVRPLIDIRVRFGQKYGLDLRSKSDAQVGESIIKACCEKILGHKIYKNEIDWNLKFRYEPPAFLSFHTPQLQRAFEAIKRAIFSLGPAGTVIMPPQLDSLEIALNKSVYRLGIGGLHSKDTRSVYKSDSEFQILSPDVASYYPNLIINSGKYPPALGPTMLTVYAGLKDQRLEAKAREKKLKKIGDTKDPAFVEGYEAHCDNEGGKVSINGPFGKLNNIYSSLNAPEMFIQTTVTGQLSLLMLIELYEMYGIPVISANTDGIVVRCPRSQIPTSEEIISHWQKVTGLDLDVTEYAAIYCRDVNNYFAIETSGEVKRKGEYSKAGLIEKKNPDVEICGDAVAEFLSKGTPILYTIAASRDIRKFVTIQKVAGGAVKLWGPGPNKDMKVKDMIPTLLAHGWERRGHRWFKEGMGNSSEEFNFKGGYNPRDAYRTCFAPQRPEYLGKVIRWYYSTEAPGSIIYNTNGNTVSLSYGGRPCMTLPDEFPSDIDYRWYLANCEKILKDIGYYDHHCAVCNCEIKAGICQNYGCERFGNR